MDVGKCLKVKIKVVTFKNWKLKVPLIPAYYQNIMKKYRQSNHSIGDILEPQNGELECRRGGFWYVLQPNATYHQRADLGLKFTVDHTAGGTLTNGNDQVIDYGTETNTVVGAVTPSELRISLKAGNIAGLLAERTGESSCSPSGPGGECQLVYYGRCEERCEALRQDGVQGWKIEYDFKDSLKQPQAVKCRKCPTSRNCSINIRRRILFLLLPVIQELK